MLSVLLLLAFFQLALHLGSLLSWEMCAPHPHPSLGHLEETAQELQGDRKVVGVWDRPVGESVAAGRAQTVSRGRGRLACGRDLPSSHVLL